MNASPSPGPQFVCTVLHEDQPLGFLVIDSLVAGRSCGGLRLMPDVDEAELRLLAHDMTLKYGFLGLPQGGAKAGVLGDPEAPREVRWARLEIFARALAPLLRSRLYVPGTDIGTANADLRHLLASAGVPVRRRELRGTRSGYYTALTVFSAARQACRHRGLALPGLPVAVEGFGHVGAELARLFHDAGATVVAVSTSHGAIYAPAGLDVPPLQSLASSHGSRFVERYPAATRLDPAALLELPVTLLCPCARHHSLHEANSARVQAQLVVPGANSPLTPAAERLLASRGILCLPDFVCNSGGVLGGTMEFAGLTEAQIRRFVDAQFEPRVAAFLQEAERRGVTPREVAEPLALRRFALVQQAAAHPSVRGRLLSVGLELYRRGLIPPALIARPALRYFHSRLSP